VKGFGPAEGGFRGKTSGPLSHSVRGVWERARAQKPVGEGSAGSIFEVDVMFTGF